MAVSHGKNWTLSKSSRKSSDNSFQQEEKKRLVFGRKIGRPLTVSLQKIYDELSPKLSIPEDLLTEQGTVEPSTFFKKDFSEYWLEIGFGGGEHLHALVMHYSDVGFLGAEPYLNGAAAFYKSLNGEARENARILKDDALKLVHSLCDGSVNRIYVLNPDPWPKRRHNKRRMVRLETLSYFSRILKPGGFLIMATDVDDLAEWMATECMNHPDFEWTAQSAKDWQTPPPEWIETRYAFKGKKAGRSQTFLIFKRKK